MKEANLNSPRARLPLTIHDGGQAKSQKTQKKEILNKQFAA